MATDNLEINNNSDRVRSSTTESVNDEIDRQTDRNIKAFSALGEEGVKARIQQLDKEWDIERVLEVNASTLALTGLALGVFVNKKWLFLPAGVLTFLLQHGLQGWCPPLPILRMLGVRTRGEIDREKYALLESIKG
ncbi:YgaP family membrane protein [Methylobacillus pratensis]